jgi:hypothetical protein
MPTLTKQCKGKLSEQTRLILRDSRDRAEWGLYPCEICGQSVGVLEINGDWVPERHWPSVIYNVRKPGNVRHHAKPPDTD